MRASQPNLGVVIPLHRTRRMRARRVKAEDLKLGEIAVAFEHPEVGALQGAAEDVSIHGLSIVVRSEPRGLRTGDRLEHVRVACDAGVLHDGSAVVRRVTERGDAW